VRRTFIDCTAPALATIEATRKRVRDPQYWQGAWAGGAGASVVELATGHDPMVSAPEQLARVLLACAT